MATNTYSTRKLAVTVTKKSQARMPSAWLRTNVILLLSIDSTAHWLRPINLLAKRAGERSAGNLHAPFDVAGDGNQLTVRLVGTPEETGSNRSIAPTEPGAIPRPYQSINKADECITTGVLAELQREALLCYAKTSSGSRRSLFEAI